MDFMSRDIRAFVGLVVMLLLILCYGRATISIFDICALSCVIIFFSIEFLWQRSLWNNIFSYYAVIIFYLLLFRTLRADELNRDIFIGIWVRVGYLLSIFSIIVFVLHQFTILNTDFFNFSSLGGFGNYNYQFSLFGLSLNKNFGSFTLVRSHGYFIEPQYAAFYFTINVLLSSMLNKNRYYRGFYTSNILAGLLTFSVTFYMSMVLFHVFKLLSNRFDFFASAFVFIIFVVFLFILILLPEQISNGDMVSNGLLNISHTSFSDRMIRMSNGMNILTNSSFFNFLLGHGVNFKNDSDRALSSGFFNVLVKRGLFGFIFVMTMLAIFLRRNYLSFLICFLYFFAIAWYVDYIFWIGILALWAGGYIETSTEKDINRVQIE